MKKHTPIYILKQFFIPTRVFIAVLIVAGFWIAPIAFASEAEPE